MGDSIIARLDKLPPSLVAHLMQPGEYHFAIVLELGIEDASYVLKHDCTRIAFLHESQRLWEEIALIVSAELLACHRKGGAGYAACEKVNLSLVGFSRKGMHVSFDYIPPGSIEPESRAGRWLDLDECDMVEPGLFKA